MPRMLFLEKVIRIIRATRAKLRKSLLNQVLARHVSRLCQTHNVQDGRSHVGQYAILHLSVLVRCHVDEGHGVQRVSRVGGAVFVDGVVGIAVVGDDDDLVVIGLAASTVSRTQLSIATTAFSMASYTPV